MHNPIHQAKTDFLRAKERLARVLANTADDKLNWSPSSTARTPLHQAAHAADALRNIHNFLDGRPFEVGSPAEADKGFRQWERQFSTREAVVDLLETNSAAYLSWLDTLSPNRLDSMIELPFGLGPAPLRVALTFPPAHTNDHAAQIEYIQTCYGDQDWHL